MILSVQSVSSDGAMSFFLLSGVIHPRRGGTFGLAAVFVKW